MATSRWNPDGKTRPASYETPVQHWLWAHNQIAVLVLAVAEVLALIIVDHTALAERYGPYIGRVYGGALALVGIEVLLWRFVYRHGGVEARWAAGLMGAWFGIMMLVQFARASIDVPVNRWSLALLGYMLAAHGVYAVFGSRARH